MSRLTNRVSPILVAALLAISPLAANSQSVEEKPLAKEEWFEIDVEGVVKSINAETREIQLDVGEQGVITLTAGDNVERFDEVSVGDIIIAQYWTFLRAEFREPTEEEMAAPLVILQEAGKAPPEVDPAGAVGEVVRAVVEVVAVDTESRRAAIMGPRGNALVVPVQDDAVLNNLTVGEKLVVEFAQAFSISLVKQD